LRERLIPIGAGLCSTERQRWPMACACIQTFDPLRTGLLTMVSGCAPPDPGNASAASAVSGPQICSPDRALLTPQPAPDCGFGRADLKTLDPDQWARLKLEYELKCYKDAEKITRKRLQQLQVAMKCEAPSA